MEFISAEVLPGGQVASALTACQHWGLKTRYVGKVGDDAAADLQRRELAQAGVEAHLLSVPGCCSQVAFILVDQSCGERTILWKRDPRLTQPPEELEREWIRSEEHTSELQSRGHLVCRLLLEKKKTYQTTPTFDNTL